MRKLDGGLAARPYFREVRRRNCVELLVDGGNTLAQPIDLRFQTPDRTSSFLGRGAFNDSLNFADRAFELPQALTLVGEDGDGKRLHLFRQLILENRESGFAAGYD